MNTLTPPSRIITPYISAFKLTVLASRSDRDSTLAHLGALEIGGAGEGGLALFVSPLDAEMYRQRHARVCSSGDHLRLCPLDQFDLHAYARDRRGKLGYSFVFGFGASPSQRIVLDPGGDLSAWITPGGCQVPPGIEEPVTFHFAPASTEFIESEWRRIGGREHADSLPALAEWSDDQLHEKAAAALADIGTTPRGDRSCAHWAFYDASANHWRFGLTQQAARKRLKVIPGKKQP